MPEYLTTAEVAKELRRSHSLIWRWATKHSIGQKIAGRFVFTPGDVATLAARMGKIGRPRRKR